VADLTVLPFEEPCAGPPPVGPEASLILSR